MLLAVEPVRAALEFAALKVGPRRPQPAGDGHQVVIFPGLASNGTAVAPLRQYCQQLGYAACDWGRGFNTGPHGELDPWLAALAAHVSTLAPATGAPLTLVGWSLGGLYARELAKLLPTQVRQVITIGTPFNASADHSNVGWLYRLLRGAAPPLNDALAQRLRTPPPVPTTSIYSRSDGIVAWQTCCHGAPWPRVQDIEIAGSHVGMAWNPAVLRVVGERLAQRPGHWQPYATAAAAGAATAAC